MDTQTKTNNLGATNKTFSTMSDVTVMDKLKTLVELAKSCYGPNGRLKMIQSQCGGHVTVTSTSQRLFSNMPISHPVVKVIIHGVQNQLKAASDFGLFTCLLCCSLVLNMLKSGENQLLCSRAVAKLANFCHEYLTSDECEAMLSINFDSHKPLLAVVRTVIDSKPGCCLINETEKETIAGILLKAFLNSFDTSDCTNIKLLPVLTSTIEGKPVLESHLIDGILFDAPTIPAHLSWKWAWKRNARSQIKVVVFSASLSGDTNLFPDVQYNVASGLSSDKMVVDRILKIMNQAIKDEVNIVACQKVIHPSVIRHLARHGVFSLERLSIRFIHAVEKLCGAVLVQTLISEDMTSYYGYLDDVEHRVINGRSYLHLSNANIKVQTIVLCQRTDQSLEELKHVCNTAIDTLTHLLRDSKVFVGGGCLESHLAHKIRKSVQENKHQVKEELNCSEAQLSVLSDTFAACLETVAMSTVESTDFHFSDGKYHHCWASVVTDDDDADNSNKVCTCRLVQKCDVNADDFRTMGFSGKDHHSTMSEPADIRPLQIVSGKEKVDLFRSKLMAFRTATEIASTALMVDNIIY